jgi:hypothetical protein
MMIQDVYFWGGKEDCIAVEVVFVRRICSLLVYWSCFSDTVNPSALPLDA